MIMITVDGDTFPMRVTLNREGFEWKPKDKVWWKLVGVSLNATLEAIRPEIVTLLVTLSHVDASEKQLSDKVLKIKLNGESSGVDYYNLFNESICGQIITNDLNEAPLPPKSKKKFIDEGFFG